MLGDLGGDKPRTEAIASKPRSAWTAKLRKWLRLSRAPIAGVVLLALAAAVVGVETIPALRWRADIIEAKFSGRLEGLTWSELLHMTRPGSQYFLWGIADGRSLGGTLANPFDSTEDVRAGEQLFRERCSVCHGVDAKGGRGPNLTNPRFRHGDSDWSIYRTLRDGVAGTAMVPTGLEQAQAFRVIAFIRDRQHKEAGVPIPPSVAHVTVDVPAAELAGAGDRLHEWLTYSRTLDGQRFSPLSQITPANAGSLKVLWVHQLESEEREIEATPLVANGVMFVTEPPNAVVALNAKTGDQIWRRAWDLPDKLALCCGKHNRGVGLLDRSVYLGTLDGRVMALDSRDGTTKWEKKVTSPSDGYSITAAPVIISDEVIVGIGGGDYGVRGFLIALDAATGQERWRFYTTPGPGEAGHDSWAGDSWKTGGAPTWVPGSYDPETDLIFWGVGNPSPNYSGDTRAGDNLYSDSMIALHRTTGKLAWYFQFTPHDERDWDACQTPIVADIVMSGVTRKVVVTANRNGFYYVLDRATGEFLVGTPFIKETWATGLDARGRPIEAPDSRPTLGGVLIYPGDSGATNWQQPAFNPALSTFFVHATEGGAVFSKTPVGQERHENGELYVASGTSTQQSTSVIRALDAATGKTKWEYFAPRAPETTGRTGVLATAGNLVMSGSRGYFFALDATNGQELWRLAMGGGTYAAPMTFLTEDDKQVIIVSAGRAIFSLGL
jgi:alcohol dehydrogenase (cytochrome c)